MFNNHRYQTLLAAIAVAGVAIFIGCDKASDDNNSPASKPPEKLVAANPITPQPPATATAGESPAPQQSCTVAAAEFAKWFKDGQVTKDGFVTAADSLQALDSTCDFYKWSWRMFLWQMSKSADGLVFNSPPFFDLNDSNNLVSNQPGVASVKALRGGKQEQTGRTGQAGLVSGVLMAQAVGVNPDGSLVYYGIHVNDVYAYLASGVNSKELTGVTQFPISPSERDAIVAYAKKAYGVDIGDANALAIELKSSWIKPTDSMDLQKFITIKSDIPMYTRGNDQKWTWDGTTMEKGVTLACVGYHLVGSISGHPEMIWATFEHAQNVPDDNYYYLASDGTATLEKNWNADGTPIRKTWLFMDGQSKKQSMNQMRMEMKGTDIVATPGNTIGPGNTMRSHPWGGAPDQSSATNNTLILSINNNIASMLAEGDVRRNYFLVGATWTRNGVPGVGVQIPDVAGSLTLSNATMETYMQYKNCFDCHKGGNLNGLSHIFGIIKPLPK